MSFSSPEPGLAARSIAGDYAAWNYFESIDSPANRDFVARFRAKFGPQRLLSDPLEASYLGVHLWAQAVRAAGSDDPAAIRRALSGQRFQAPEGEVRVDPETHHLWKTARVARITSKGTAEVVWSSAEPVRPIPFPASRSRAQWEHYLTDLHQRWGGEWFPPGPGPGRWKPRPVPSPEELAKLPAAADALKRQAIPAELLEQAGGGDPDKAPPELVAILGEDRHQGTDKSRCQLYTVAISPDGKTLAAGGLDKVVRLWDLATGKVRHELTGHQQPDVFTLYTLAFSPDGTLLASGDREGTIKLWDVATGRERGTLAEPGGRLHQIAFSPDGRFLAAARQTGGVQLWKVPGGKLHSTLPGNKEVWYVAFSPDGRTLASSEGSRVQLWDVATGTNTGSLPDQGGTVRWIGFHPDGSSLVTATSYPQRDPSLKVWDLTTLQEKQRLEGHTSTVLSGAWRADGRLLATAGETDGTVRLWDLSSDPPRCKVLHVIPPKVPWLHQIAFSPEGRHLALTNPNGTVYILRLAPPGKVFRVP
jgi:WD40 repeat protein